MKQIIIAVTMSLAFATAGCMSSYYGQYERDESVRADTLPPAMTKEDIVALTKEGIDNQVIIDQIKATQSYFQLNAQDIIDLKKAGVSDSVLSVMIKGPEPQKARRIGRRHYSYPSSYGYPYYGYPYYYPYGYPSYGHHYPSYYYGGGHGFGGHYSGGHGFGGHGYSGGHGSGGHGSGGHRSSGSHR